MIIFSKPTNKFGTFYQRQLPSETKLLILTDEDCDQLPRFHVHLAGQVGCLLAEGLLCRRHGR